MGVVVESSGCVRTRRRHCRRHRDEGDGGRETEGDGEGALSLSSCRCRVVGARRHVIVARWLLSSHVKEEGEEGEDEVWARRCRRCRVVVVACEGVRVKSRWVRTRDRRGAVVASSLSRVEGGSGGYANPCRGYGYERGSARPYLYPWYALDMSDRAREDMVEVGYERLRPN